MDKETQNYIDRKFSELEKKLGNEIPGVNKPLLIPEVSILNWNNSAGALPQALLDIEDLQDRVEILENT